MADRNPGFKQHARLRTQQNSETPASCYGIMFPERGELVGDLSTLAESLSMLVGMQPEQNSKF